MLRKDIANYRGCFWWWC